MNGVQLGLLGVEESQAATRRRARRKSRPSERAVQVEVDDAGTPSLITKVILDTTYEPAAVDAGPPPDDWGPTFDVTLRDGHLAIAAVTSESAWVDQAVARLESVVGPTVKWRGTRERSFPAGKLDLLLCVAAPNVATLDVGALSVARGMWAHAHRMPAIRVIDDGAGLAGTAEHWPAGWRISRVPWHALAALIANGVRVDIPDELTVRLSKALDGDGITVATGELAGPSVVLTTDLSADVVAEMLDLPVVIRVRPGVVHVPVGNAGPLLGAPGVRLPIHTQRAIEAAVGDPDPLPPELYERIPWTPHAFQEMDVALLAHYVRNRGGGAVLAGDMGSGKTLQSLMLVELLEAWPALITCPPAAITSWESHLRQMGRSFHLYEGDVADTFRQIQTGNFDALLVSMSSLTRLVDLVESWRPGSMLVDEVHDIRSPGSQKSRAVRRLAGAARVMRLGLSGTPIQNRLSDALPMGAFVLPGQFDARPKKSTLQGRYAGSDVEEAVAEHLGSIMVRRLKEDTGLNLPPMHDRLVEVELAPEQLAALRDIAQQMTQGPPETRMHAFAALGKARQIISAPATQGLSCRNPKVDKALDVVTGMHAEGRRTVLFTSSRQGWADLAQGLQQRGLPWTGIHGGHSMRDRRKAEHRFVQGDAVAFVGSIMACCQSLTLSPAGTAAVVLDLPWSPGVLDQALARIHRANTVRSVDALLLQATDPSGLPTIDHRVWEIQTEKRRLIAKVVDRTEHTSDIEVVLSDEDVRYLLTGHRPAALVG